MSEPPPVRVEPLEPAAGVGMLAYASRGDRGIDWRAVLTAVILIGVVIRLAYSVTRPVTVAAFAALPDQIEYLATAESLLGGNGYVFDDLSAGEKVYAFRMPGYPLLIAACGAKVRIVFAVQALLDASSCLAVYRIARRRATEPTAVLAAAAVAVNPYLIQFSCLLLSETLFTACLAWGVCGLLGSTRRTKWAGVGLLLLSVYVRPSAIGLGVVAAAVVFAGGISLVRNIGGAALAAGLLVGVLYPWASRNQRVLGLKIWTTTNSGYTAYDSFNPRADGSSNQGWFRRGDGPFAGEIFESLPTTRPLQSWQRRRDGGEIARSDTLNRLAWDYAKSHPRRDVELAFAKLARFWSPVPLSADFGGRWLYVIVGGLYVIPLFILAAIGVWRGGLGKRTTLILLLPALYFSVVHCVFVGSLRYRVPCDVPLAVLAAAGAASFVHAKAETT